MTISVATEMTLAEKNDQLPPVCHLYFEFDIVN